MLKELRKKEFKNGVVYSLETNDGYLIEVTDTFLPYYTKDAIGRKQNKLVDYDLGSRNDRWMIGVSVMSGCPVGCKFCATGKMKKCRNLTSEEIYDQVMFVLDKNKEYRPKRSKEFKINYTRMGEPFLNIDNVKECIDMVDSMLYDTNTHHYISTIGIKDADYSWIKNNVTLQFSVHSFDEEYRDWLIPFKNKISLEDMGKVRTQSSLKTTLNLTMAREEDFDIEKMKKWFSKDNFFVKVSPINPNDVSEKNGLVDGVIKQQNIV